MTVADAKALIAKKRAQLAGLGTLREFRGTTVVDTRRRLESEIAALDIWIREHGAA